MLTALSHFKRCVCLPVSLAFLQSSHGDMNYTSSVCEAEQEFFKLYLYIIVIFIWFRQQPCSSVVCTMYQYCSKVSLPGKVANSTLCTITVISEKEKKLKTSTSDDLLVYHDRTLPPPPIRKPFSLSVCYCGPILCYRARISSFFLLVTKVNPRLHSSLVL